MKPGAIVPVLGSNSSSMLPQRASTGRPRPNRRLARQPDRQRARWLAQRQPARQLAGPAADPLARRPTRWPAIWLYPLFRRSTYGLAGWPSIRPARRAAGFPACLPVQPPAWLAHRLGMGRLYNVAAELSLLSCPPLPSLYLNSKSPNGVKVPAPVNSYTSRCLRDARGVPAHSYFRIWRCLRDACAQHNHVQARCPRL